MADDEQSNPGRFDQASRVDAARFLRIFAVTVLCVALLVSTVNLVAWRYMQRADNQSIVQLLSGWGRMYKPILYDEIRPQVAVFGASWARDAFDPVVTGQVIGKTVFNHGVSGGTAYETRRFADASLDNAALEAAIVNLDTFYRSELSARTRYGFDESILDVDPERKPVRWVDLKRTYSLALTGWAAGANLKLISTVLARDSGVARHEYLEAYEKGDHRRRRGRMAKIRARIFPAAPVPPKAANPIALKTPAELEWLIDGFCARSVDVYAYFTPAHMHQNNCDAEASEEFAVLELLRRKQASCDARIRYFDFAYPNAMTLEGVFTEVRASQYYRPDGHPRPTVGLAMAARMFDRELPVTASALLRQDFGVELLRHADAEGWILKRAARCRGDWGEGGHADFVNALMKGTKGVSID